jgi:hemolysin activation/secretion protein
MVWRTASCCVLLSLSFIARNISAQEIERQLTPPPEPRANTEVVIPEAPQQVAPRPELAGLKFRLNEVRVEGGSVLSTNELQQAYAAWIGKDVTVEELYGIAAALTRLYRDRGYVLTMVTVPPQRISNGIARLQATEGVLDDVRFTGDTSHRPGMLAAVKQRLLGSKPLRTRDLERELLLLNDLPGLAADATLAPSETTRGASTLHVRLRQDRTAFSAGATNRGSEFLGPAQYDAQIELDSLFGLRDGTNIRYLTTGSNDELRFFSLAHTQHLGSRGLTLTLSGSRSDSDPPLRNLQPELSLETSATNAHVELAYPLLRSRRTNVSMRGGVSYHDGRTEFPFFDINLSRDKIASAQVGITLDFVDALRGVNIIDLEYSQGLDAFGASEEGDPELSRAGGRPDFSKATLYAARLQGLWGRWSLLAAATGQLAFTNLVSSEEFAFGGEFFGRAYDASELVGDSGIGGKLELRYTHEFPSAWAVTGYGFGEAGQIWRRLASAEEVGRSESATSAGLGVRFDASQWLTGYVEVAWPLDRIVLAEGDDDPRVFGGFRVKL